MTYKNIFLPLLSGLSCPRFWVWVFLCGFRIPELRVLIGNNFRSRHILGHGFAGPESELITVYSGATWPLTTTEYLGPQATPARGARIDRTLLMFDFV